LGTDSTLTAAGDLLDELRFAGRMVEPRRLYRMVTRDAANLMRLDCGEGRVRQSGAADLLVIADHGGAPSDALAEMRPELVMVRGVVKLISSGLEEALGPFDGFRPLAIEGRGRWFLPASHVVRIERLGQLLPLGLQLVGRAAS